MKYILLALFIASIFCVQCYSEGDPHVRSFNNQKFDFQEEGDYVLVEAPGLKAHTRQRSWGKTARVITEVALKFGRRGKKIFVRNAKFNTFEYGNTLKSFPAKGKSVQLTKKLTLVRTGDNTVRFETKNWKVTVNGNDGTGKNWPQSHYLNLIVDSVKPVTNKWKGTCVKQTLKAQGLFTLFIRKHKGDKHKLCTRSKLEEAVRHCRRYNFKVQAHYNDCVFDRCHGLSAKATRKFFDKEKKDKRKLRRLVRRRKAARRAARRRVTRRRRVSRRRVTRRRRAARRVTRRNRRVARRNRRVTRRRVTRRNRRVSRRRVVRRRRATRRNRRVSRRRVTRRRRVSRRVARKNRKLRKTLKWYRRQVVSLRNLVRRLSKNCPRRK